MPILFCNVAWMKAYAGRTDKDPPLGGGRFPRVEGYCGEECNFVPGEDGWVYGHFETIKDRIDREVRIDRLGADRLADFAEGVDVIWTAPAAGKGSRVVVGWWRDARVYRRRQVFNGNYPSSRHRRDEITSFRVRARTQDAVLLPPAERTLTLQHGPGWSGQASWWYAEESRNLDVQRFLASIRRAIRKKGRATPPAQASVAGNGTQGRAGAAAAEAYRRYARRYEATVQPRHHELQRRFVAYLRRQHAPVTFPACFRDDLRYRQGNEPEIMVEVKPSDASCVRLAIRTAIGQLLDYRQHQQWAGPQLILVETPVTNADDLALALQNGFGIAWPEGKTFDIRWPS